MDLSNFKITVQPLEQKVKHVNRNTGEIVESNEMKIMWKHLTLDVSEFDFYLRENHPNWSETLSIREQEILHIWMKELGYDELYFEVNNKTIEEKGKVKLQEQIDNWLQPNATTQLPAADVEEI